MGEISYTLSMETPEWQKERDNAGQDDFTVTSIERKLKDILEAFEAAAEARAKFIDCYPLWIEDTKEIIDKLKKIADGLDEQKKNVNIATVVGSSVGIGGGTALLVGSILLPIFPIASPFLFVGGAVAAGLGSITNTGSAAVGEILKKLDTDKVKKMLEEYKNKYSYVEEWIKCSQRLEQAIEKLMRIDVFNELKGNFLCLFNDLLYNDQEEYSDCNEQSEVRLEMVARIIESILRKFMFNSIEKEIILAIVLNRRLLKLLRCIITYHEKNPLVCQSVMVTAKITLGGTQVIALLYRGGLIAGNAGRFAAIASRQVTRTVVRGALSAVSIALDTLSLVLAANQLHKKSACEYAIKIREAAEGLQKEMECYHLVYETLRYIALDATTNQL